MNFLCLVVAVDDIHGFTLGAVTVGKHGDHFTILDQRELVAVGFKLHEPPRLNRWGIAALRFVLLA